MPRPRLLEKRLEQVEDRRGSAARARKRCGGAPAAVVAHRGSPGRDHSRDAELGAGVNTGDRPRLALSYEAAP